MRLLTCLVAMALLVARPARAQEDQARRVVIGEIDLRAYPQVRVAFQLTDVSGFEMAPADVSQLRLRIDGSTAVTATGGISLTHTPLAVAIVLDASAAMSDSSTLAHTRFDDMLAQFSELLYRLPSDSLISVISFAGEPVVLQKLGADGGGAMNVRDRLQLQGPPGAADGGAAGYALEAAVREARAQLAGYAGQRALVVLASGAADASSAELAPAGQEQLPALVIGFGSDQEGQFVTHPAAPAALRQLSERLGGRFIAFGAGGLEETAFEQTQRELGALFDRLVQRSQSYEIRFATPALTAGPHRLEIAVGDARGEAPFDLSALPTRLEVRFEPAEAQWQGPVELSVAVQSAQGDIAAVDYLLGNHLIGRATAGPDFKLSFDPYAAENQALIEAQATHILRAAAVDAAGITTMSPEVAVAIVPPGRGTPIPLAPILGGVGIAVAGGAAVLAARALRGRRRSTAAEHSSEQKGVNDWNTAPASVFDEKTGPLPGTVQDEKTGPLPGTVSLGENRLAVVVREGPRDCLGQQYPLVGGMMHIGRGAQSTGDLCIPESYVSNPHAILRQVNDTAVMISDNQSAHGTFLGDGKVRVLGAQAQQLRVGDVFWITPNIKLQLIEARSK